MIIKEMKQKREQNKQFSLKRQILEKFSDYILLGGEGSEIEESFLFTFFKTLAYLPQVNSFEFQVYQINIMASWLIVPILQLWLNEYFLDSPFLVYIFYEIYAWFLLPGLVEWIFFLRTTDFRKYVVKYLFFYFIHLGLTLSNFINEEKQNRVSLHLNLHTFYFMCLVIDFCFPYKIRQGRKIVKIRYVDQKLKQVGEDQENQNHMNFNEFNAVQQDFTILSPLNGNYICVSFENMYLIIDLTNLQIITSITSALKITPIQYFKENNTLIAMKSINPISNSLTLQDVY
ncbi:hypothetical protein PPERSA_08937 [Pseudocohnilembus persalinus]|uniref:Transmembrane protein n=1 Tax=Pseudocohnilembus persalinus TaxID=266149 RepID=A0A0V0R2W8_PSEPJ|nr:hypothetical protein PPERSA_08937 [Pseudocohnilembus persalinus]|eukprot:KRX08833.1 hypothetical protein PPERSA_08937 [Pseudocohnilembus persalinus]